MASFSGFGAQMVVTPSGGAAVTIDAKTILNAIDPLLATDCKNRYWAQGPVLTAVILEDCTQTTAYDFGCTWNGTTMSACVTSSNSSAASLHPKFILWFYPQSSNVLVEYVLENTWIGREQDQSIAIALNAGSTNTQVYSHSTFPLKSRTLFRKQFWSGTVPGHIRIGHNFAYLIATKALPNFDLSGAAFVDPTPDYNTFAAGDRGDVNGIALMSWLDYADNNEVAPVQREDLEYLYHMDDANCGSPNSACAKAWDILTGEVDANPSTTLSGVASGGGVWGAMQNVSFHFRESRTTGNHYFVPNFDSKMPRPPRPTTGLWWRWEGCFRATRTRRIRLSVPDR